VPIRRFIDEGKALDPEALQSMNAALLGACKTLGVKVKDDYTTRLLASNWLARASAIQNSSALQLSMPFTNHPLGNVSRCGCVRAGFARPISFGYARGCANANDGSNAATMLQF
jgi:hypothetical protein